MTIATTAELTEALPSVLAQVQKSPVFIRDGEREVAVMMSLEAFEKIRLERLERFEQSRDVMAAELEANLAKDGISVEEFLADLLKDD